MNMSYKRIFWGVILIILGVLFVLKNLGVLFFSWRDLIHLWPLLLILWGISLIPVKDYLKVILSLVVVALAFWLIQSPDYGPDWRHNGDRQWHWEWDSDDNSSPGAYHEQEFSEEYDSSLVAAILKFDGGAGAFRIQGSTDQLIDVDTRGKATYSMTSKDFDEGREIHIKMKEHHGSESRNRMKIEMNPNPVWDMNLDCGAADLDADLSEFKIKTIDLDAGAADINIRLGDLYPDVTVKIDAGASDVDLQVPESVGCVIKVSSVLADRNFPGFNRISNGHFETEGFEEAEKKIYIDIDVAVADVRVERY